jgi:hypothetical protein
MYPQISIRTGECFSMLFLSLNMLLFYTDLHIYLTTTRDKHASDTQATIALNESTMMQHMCSQIKQ